MSGTDLVFRPLSRSAAARLNTINRACPIEADFTLLFERGTDFFRWPDVAFDHYQYLGAFCGDVLVGYLMVGWFTGWVEEAFVTCGYLGDARVLPEYRGHRTTEQLMYAIEQFVPSDARLGYSLVKKGNQPAESLAVSTNSAIYESHPLTDFVAVNIPLLHPLHMPSQISVRAACLEDFPAMAALFSRVNAGKLFAPPMTEARLRADLEKLPHLSDYRVAERNGKLAGMLAACDLSPFHSTHILKYSTGAKVMRMAYNLIAGFNPGSVRLPSAGGELCTLTLSRVGIEDNDPNILRAMLSHLIRENLGKGYHLLTLGFAAEDPLIQAVHGFPLVQRFVSTINCINRRTVPFESTGQLPYIDLMMI